MGKILFAKRISILTVVLCVAALAVAQEFTVGNIKYRVLDATAKTVRITDGKSTTGDITIPSTVTEGGVTYTVKEIGFKAFENNRNITSVEIPSSIDSIGEYAFYECEEVTEYTLNNGLKIIGLGAFASAKKITSFKIPASVVNIGVHAFLFCEELTRFVVDPANTVYVSEDGILYNKDKSELIKFPAAKNLSAYTMPNSVKIAKMGAMEGCGKIENIVFSENLDEIEEAAFMNCLRIEKVDLPAKLTTIGQQAFASCLKLHTINIPASVKKIESSSFYMSGRLQNINVDPANTEYLSEDGILFNKSKTSLITYPSGKQEDTYKVPSTVTSIESRAFISTLALHNVDLPASLTKINTAAFFGCSKLQEIICRAAVPPALANNVFGGGVIASKVVLKVPTSAIAAYKAAEVWKNFKIEGADLSFCSPVEQDKYEVYPTYTEGIVFVVADREGKATVYNTLGQMVKTTSLQQGENSIDLSSQPTGNYVLVVGNKTFKIIKR
jgi:cell surface protein